MKKVINEKEIEKIIFLYTKEKLNIRRISIKLKISDKKISEILRDNNINLSRKIKISSGDIFNETIVIMEIEKEKQGRMFLYECGECHKHFKISLCGLRRGRKYCPSCSAKKRFYKRNLKFIGKRFGKLLIIEILPAKSRTFHVMAKCDCGVIKKCALSNLKNGTTKSCGCLKTKKYCNKKENVIGKKYGRLTVIEEIEKEGVGYARIVLCSCECGGENKTYRLGKLRMGTTKSCGCFSRENINKKYEHYKDRYPNFIKVEEIMDDPNGYGILVRCKKCNEWFKPYPSQLWSRIQAIENPRKYEEHNFYCSDECKNSCPLFNLKYDPYKKEDANTDTYDLKIWKEEVFKQQLVREGENFCEICGEENKLNSHHVIPRKIDNFYSFDPDNGIVLCKKCHYKYGHKDECSLGSLAHKICG